MPGYPGTPSKNSPYFEVSTVSDVINRSYKIFSFQILAKNIIYILANFSRIMLKLAKIYAKISQISKKMANFSIILLKLAKI